MASLNFNISDPRGHPWGKHGKAKSDVAIHCTLPTTPNNDTLAPIAIGNVLDGRPGSVVRWSCPDGSRLVGKRKTTCLHTGEWSHERPTCEQDPVVFVARNRDYTESHEQPTTYRTTDASETEPNSRMTLVISVSVIVATVLIAAFLIALAYYYYQYKKERGKRKQSCCIESPCLEHGPWTLDNSRTKRRHSTPRHPHPVNHEISQNLISPLDQVVYPYSQPPPSNPRRNSRRNEQNSYLDYDSKMETVGYYDKHGNPVNPSPDENNNKLARVFDSRTTFEETDQRPLHTSKCNKCTNMSSNKFLESCICSFGSASEKDNRLAYTKNNDDRKTSLYNQDVYFGNQGQYGTPSQEPPFQSGGNVFRHNALQNFVSATGFSQPYGMVQYTTPAATTAPDNQRNRIQSSGAINDQYRRYTPYTTPQAFQYVPVYALPKSNVCYSEEGHVTPLNPIPETQPTSYQWSSYSNPKRPTLASVMETFHRSARPKAKRGGSGIYESLPKNNDQRGPTGGSRSRDRMSGVGSSHSVEPSLPGMELACSGARSVDSGEYTKKLPRTGNLPFDEV